MQTEIQEKLTQMAAQYPAFPDGRINYTGATEACAVVVFVRCKDKILLMKRSDQVQWYKGKWDVIAGYYDEFVEPEVKALEELREEGGILPEDIASMKVGKMFTKKDAVLGTTWDDVPVLVELKSQKEIVLDFEHTEYVWVSFDELKKYDMAVPFSADFLKLFE